MKVRSEIVNGKRQIIIIMHTSRDDSKVKDAMLKTMGLNGTSRIKKITENRYGFERIYKSIQ